MNYIKINPELKKLIPPLSEQEFDQLAKNCLKEGIRDAICIWDGFIIDGHNRYEISKIYDLEYHVRTFDFEDESEVKDWMIKNQLGKRNLTKEQKSYLRGLQYRREKKKQGSNNQYIQESEKSQNGTFPETKTRLAKEHKVSKNTILRDEKYTTALEFIADVAGDEVKNKILNREIKSTQKDILAMARKPVEKIKEIALKAIDVKDLKKVNGAHVGKNSGENEWYTPKHIIDCVRELYGGGIDLDPASSITANTNVKASHIFTADDNGLEKGWFGNVWLNPPYAQPLITDFSNKVVSEKSNYESCIVLVNNATETKWFQNIVSVSSAICFPSSRVKFWHPDRGNSAPLQGQAIIYIGKDVNRFKSIFSPLGFLVYA